MIISRSVLLWMRSVWDKTCRKNQNTILCWMQFFFRKSCRLWNNVEKYDTARQFTDDSMAQTHYMQDTYGYKLTLRVCNIYCFSTAIMVTRTRLNVTLYVRDLSCLVLNLVTASLYKVKLVQFCGACLNNHDNISKTISSVSFTCPKVCSQKWFWISH